MSAPGLAALDAVGQKSPAWRREYYSTIGGSAAAAALGVDKYLTRAQLFEKMVAVIHRDTLPPEKPPTDDMRRGTILEAVARKTTEKYLGVRIEPHPQDQFCYHPAYPFAHALPDGYAVWLGQKWIVEIKVPRPATIAKLNLEGVPLHWQIQTTHNTALTDAAGCLFCAFDPLAARVEVVELPADPARAARLLAGERKFFDSVLQNQPLEELPPPRPADFGLSDLPPERLILDSDEARRAAAAYLRMRELHVETAEALEAAKNRLAVLAGCTLTDDGSLVGGAEAFEVPGLLRVLHRPQGGAKAFDKDKALAAFQELRDPRFWKTNQPSRPWRAYPQGD